MSAREPEKKSVRETGTGALRQHIHRDSACPHAHTRATSPTTQHNPINHPLVLVDNVLPAEKASLSSAAAAPPQAAAAISPQITQITQAQQLNLLSTQHDPTQIDTLNPITNLLTMSSPLTGLALGLAAAAPPRPAVAGAAAAGSGTAAAAACCWRTSGSGGR